MAELSIDTWASAPGPIRGALQRLSRRYPLHAHILAAWEVQSTTAIPTMAVTIRAGCVWLLVNPTFMQGCSLPELAGVLLHEANHVLFGHLLLDPRRFPNAAARTIAEEVTVNEWVGEPLPGSPVELSQFPFLPPDEDFERRYHRLCTRATVLPGVVVTTDDHGSWPAAQSGLDRLAVQSLVRTAIAKVDPEEWTKVHPKIRDAARRQATGTGRAGTVEAIVDPGMKGRIDWRRELRQFVGQRSRPTHSLHRPSRRFPQLVGVVPGHRLDTNRRRVLAVVDTSSSISGAVLTAIGTELAAFRPENDVIVAECDSRVHRVYPFDGRLDHVQGRGGTDFRSPLEPAFLRAHRADVVVYFTDGEGPAPARKPSVPVLWCLTRDGRRPSAWGAVVWM